MRGETRERGRPGEWEYFGGVHPSSSGPVIPIGFTLSLGGSGDASLCQVKERFSNITVNLNMYHILIKPFLS
jgi:hypothetical protein